MKTRFLKLTIYLYDMFALYSFIRYYDIIFFEW